MIGLRTIISLSVNADREAVQVTSGDHLRYRQEEVAFATRTFSAPPPGDADVVISNAYPNDLSLTFVHMKGTQPLRHCPPGVSRIAIASCREGLGHHGLFPLVNASRFARHQRTLRRLAVLGLPEISAKLGTAITSAWQARSSENRQPQPPRLPVARNPIWVYQPEGPSEELPSQVRGYQIRRSWSSVLEAVRREQAAKEHLRVLIYACAPLQCFSPDQTSQESISLESDLAGSAHPQKDAPASRLAAS